MASTSGTKPRSDNEWDRSGFFSKWTFYMANRMLDTGMQKSLQLEDLIDIPETDYSDEMVRKLKYHYENSTKFLFIPRLLVAMLKLIEMKALIIVFLTIIEGLIRIASPLVLIFLLRALQDSGDTDAYIWAGVLSALGIAQTLIHHVLFFFSMRVGWNWKNVCTALIYDRLFRLQGGSLQTTMKGRMVNLISNDVSRFEEFAVFVTFSWESFLEVALILLILIYILDAPSAVAGVGCTLMTIPLMIVLAKQFAYYRGKTAAATDQRVRHVTEVIEGIASVKSYAWETPFFQLIGQFRAREAESIAQSQIFRSINQGLMYATPPVVSFVTFLVFWSTGGELTVPRVFSTVSLLQVLRMTIGRQFTRSIETGSEALASCARIEAYLDTTVGPYYEEDGESNNNPQSHTLKSNPYQPLPSNNADAVHAQESKPSLGNDEAILKITNGNYYYAPSLKEAKHQEKHNITVTPVIRNINLSLSRGEILTVVGPVGCGKSTLLAAILGEMLYINNDTNATADPRSIADGVRIAYCAQNPWILAASVKANITISGRSDKSNIHDDIKKPQNIDEELYARAVESCRIVEDLVQFAAYDDTEIGERGVSVSGGQKARISLARAVYSAADLFVLDDPLSAVDAHVGKALMLDCIRDQIAGEMRRAVVLVTHQLQYLKYSHKVLVLSKTGEQIFFGSYDELIKKKELFEHLDLAEDENHMDSEEGKQGDSEENNTQMSDSPPKRTHLRYDKTYRMKSMQLKQKQQPQQLQEMGEKRNLLGSAAASVKTQGKLMENDIEEGPNKTEIIESEEERKRREIVAVEDRQLGNISIKEYWNYISSGGTLRGIFVLCVILASQALLMMTDYWLKWWATSSFGDQSDNKYIIIFAGLVTLCILLGFYRALAWFRFTLKAASHMHKLCLWAVLHSPLRFFISNPTGRILNRFAKDQNQVDETLPVTFFSFMECTVFCLAGIAMVCISIPWLILLMPLLLITFYYLRLKYITSTREIKRIEAITRSPVYSDFSATLEGLVTLRAYQLQEKITAQFQRQLDINGKAWFSFLMASRWLGFRLDLETSLVVCCVSFFAVFLRNTSTDIDVGLIGFTLNYTMALSGLFQWAVRQSAEVEAQMTSVERINAYSQLPPEDGYATHLGDVSFGELSHFGGSFAGSAMFSMKSSTRSEDHQLQHQEQRRQSQEEVPMTVTRRKALEIKELSQSIAGNVTLKDLTVTYREDLDPVLRDLSLHIPAGKKVGICGRTGSGKSSTLLALLRLNIIQQGDILIDGDKSLLKLDLETARSLISIIPQEPHLFSGTIRFNLDPFSVYTDEEIWAALADAHIADYIRSTPAQLQLKVDEGGRNFSVGQRQLLSLARAILRGCKVVLMDEVTASIDFQTDRLIQETIRKSKSLREATIITVAHRLRTIADADLIVVVHAGRIVETEPPERLLLREESLYRKLAVESGEFEEIQRAALQRDENKAQISAMIQINAEKK